MSVIDKNIDLYLDIFNKIVHPKYINDEIKLFDTKVHNKIKNISNQSINNLEQIQNKLIKYIRKKIEMSERFNIPINSYYKGIVKDYTLDIVNNYFNTIKHLKYTFVKYDTKNIKLYLDKHNYKFLDKYYNLVVLQKEIRKKFLKFDDNTMKIYNVINKTRDQLSGYLKEKFKLKVKPSNGFLKMYEILSELNMIPHKDTLFTMHIAESPGNFIAATKYKYLQLNPKGTHHWLANSLNPKTVKHALPDEYGNIKKHPDKWLFGVDNTGNILNINNILDYKSKIEEYKKKYDIKLDLLSGDLGVADNSGNDKIEDETKYLQYLQQLEVAEAVTIIFLADEDSSCVVKHFTPHLGNITLSKQAGNYFVSLLYLYYIHYKSITVIKPFSSNKASGEFYIVGKGFKKLDMDTNILEIINKYKVNHSIFNIKDIPQTFLTQVDEFVDKITTEYVNARESILFMQECYRNMKDNKDDLILKKSNCSILF